MAFISNKVIILFRYYSSFSEFFFNFSDRKDKGFPEKTKINIIFMKHRADGLRQMRPSLSLPPASGEMEQFQNQTLRPILKLQNDLLIAVCKEQFIKRKNVFFKLDTEKQLAYIEQQITRDLKFKHFLLGLICGHLTLEEWPFFYKHENELRKRITTMLVQRVQNQLSHLI